MISLQAANNGATVAATVSREAETAASATWVTANSVFQAEFQVVDRPIDVFYRILLVTTEVMFGVLQIFTRSLSARMAL